MICRYAIHAKRAVIDGHTNTTSLIEIMEEVVFGIPQGREFPQGVTAFPLESTFCSLWEAETVEETQRPMIVDFFIDTPRGEFVRRQIEITFSGKQRARAMVQLPVFPIAGEGTYTVGIEFEGRKYSWPILGRREDAPVITAVAKP